MEETTKFNLYLLKFGIKGTEQQGTALISTNSTERAVQLLNSEGVYTFQDKYEVFIITPLLNYEGDIEALIDETIFPFEV